MTETSILKQMILKALLKILREELDKVPLKGDISEWINGEDCKSITFLLEKIHELKMLD
jgi:hypothetical protein